jgi:hypothetical protein
MTYPPGEAAGTTGGAPAGGGNSPYGNGTGPVPTAPPLPGGQPKSPRRRSVGTLAATALVSALIGGGIVAAVDAFVLHDRSSSASKPSAPTSEQIHDANVKLCTSFAIVNAAMPNPQKTALDVLPQIYGLRSALAENPNASPDIRSALGALADEYEVSAADFGKVRTRGYAQPPKYDVTQAQAVYDHAWDVCQLGN